MKQIIKAFFGIVCIVIIAELTLRFLANFSQNIRFFTTNPYQQTYFAENTGWKGITAVACPKFVQYPGAELNGFILNSHGFISPEYSYQKPKGTKRIVFLGDSQTVSEVPYKKSFVRLIESRFQAEQKKFEAINLGVICVGPAMEKQVLIHEGLHFEPDVVVLGFFVGNDFVDDKDVLTTYNMYKTKTHLFPFWVYQSRFYSLLRNMRLYLVYGKKSPLLAKQNKTQIGVETNEHIDEPDTPTLSESAYTDLESKKIHLFDESSFVYATKDTIFANIMEMKQLTEQKNAKFLILIIPDELQINTTLQEKVNKKTPIDKTKISLPQTILRNFLEGQNISYIDLLPLWEASPAAQNYYRPQDTHLNIEGNQAVADILYPKLQEMLQ